MAPGCIHPRYWPISRRALSNPSAAICEMDLHYQGQASGTDIPEAPFRREQKQKSFPSFPLPKLHLLGGLDRGSSFAFPVGSRSGFRFSGTLSTGLRLESQSLSLSRSWRGASAEITSPHMPRESLHRYSAEWAGIDVGVELPGPVRAVSVSRMACVAQALNPRSTSRGRIESKSFQGPGPREFQE